MQVNTRGTARSGTRRAVVTLTGAALTVALLSQSGAGATPSPTPPPNPSNGQLSAAQNAKNALATRVGQLGASIASAQLQLRTLQGKEELAEQQVAFTLSALADARSGAQRARQRVATAQHSVDYAHRLFVEYLQARYINGDVSGLAGEVFGAKNPAALMDRSAIADYQTQTHLEAIGGFQRASVVKSNADAAARSAVAREAIAAIAANNAQRAAHAAYAAEQSQAATLRATMASSQQELNAAQEQLATLNNQRATYIAYQVEQARLARLAAIRAAKLKAERIAAARRAAEARARQEAAARAAAQARARAVAEQQARDRAAAAAANQPHDRGNSGDSVTTRRHRTASHHSSSSAVDTDLGSSGSGAPSAPSSGGWTATKGYAAVSRAMNELGLPYAWAGGGVGGPGYGVCDGSAGAPNDCNVRGFDCSGLAMFAWGQYWAHKASVQYFEAGSYHPSMGDLRPGDLVFWSYGGASDIHHVAVYKGNGEIIEAPYSGGHIQISDLYAYGQPYGATRPLT